MENTDYESLILNRQDSEADDCRNCPYASIELCRNQCEETREIVNPLLRR